MLDLEIIIIMSFNFPTHDGYNNCFFIFCIGCFQVVIVPIWKKADEKTGVLSAALSAKEVLQKSGIRVKLDDSDQRTPGWKFNFWEMKVFFEFLKIKHIVVLCHACYRWICK